MTTEQPAAGPLGHFHHIGIAVWSAEPWTERLCALLGGTVVDGGDDDKLGIGWLWIEAPVTPIVELVWPTSSEGPIALWLEDRGPGLHHLSFRSDDVSRSAQHVRSCDLQTIGQCADHAGYEELFVHPSQLGGVLVHCFRKH